MRRRLAEWLGIAGLAAWTISLYVSWSNLAVVSFGPAEIAWIAKRDLLLRYGVGLLVSGAVWLWLWSLAKRSQFRYTRKGGRTHRSPGRGTVHSG